MTGRPVGVLLANTVRFVSTVCGIRTIVDDPETAEALCPRDHPFGTKRPCLDTGYYRTFNRPHVRLVDLKATPLVEVTPAGSVPPAMSTPSTTSSSRPASTP